jgi:alkylhydroperoxidase family enzyme
MVKVPRRRKNGKAHPTYTPEPPPDPIEPPPGPRRSPIDELEARLAEPDEGPFLYGLEQRAIYPTIITELTEAGNRIVAVLHEHDHPDLWRGYEDLEAELGFVRERASFTLGWEHGSADGRADAFRTHAPGLGKRARRLADQARSLVVNGHLNPTEAAALLLETAWSILLTKPAPSFEG